MRPRQIRPLVVVLALAVVSGCGKKVPVFLCGGVATYPPPRDQVCPASPSGLASLTIVVVDVMGAALPAKVVLTAASGPAQDRTALSDASGQTVLEAEAGLYAVTVVTAGFVPQVRAVRLTSGCSGRETFAMQLVPWFE